MTRHARLTALLRYLRIGYSVGCGIVCLLLICLWVRSHHKMRHVSIPIATQVLSFDANGRLLIISLRPAHLRPWPVTSLFLHHDYPTFKMRQGPRGGLAIQTRHWIAVLATGLITVLPWIHWPKQFSLRTLLIATTLVAVLLGVAVMMLRGS
jgi:hypothetical protein